jgi:hypothetical protein
MSKQCEGEFEDTLCYPVTKHIAEYLSRPQTRVALGVDDALTGSSLSARPQRSILG